jgi:cytochrome P450
VSTAVTTPLPPHPKDFPILGSVPSFVRDTPKTFVDGWHDVGDVVLFRGLRTMTLVAHPDHVKHVLVDRSENYPRSERVVEKLAVLLGSSIFTAEGETWRRQAAIVHPFLSGERIAAFGSAITGAAEETGRRWDAAVSSGAAVDLVEEMTRASIDISARILFGPDRGGSFEDLVQASVTANEYAIAGVMAVGGPPDAPIRPAYRHYVAAIAHLDEVVRRAIEERRQEPAADLVSALLEARDPESGEGLTEKQVRDEAITFLHTTYAGVSPGLLWTWYVLATSPAVAEGVRAELADAIGGQVPSPESVGRLRFLDLVLKEVFRLYPSLWVFARVATSDDEIGGYRIPAGMSVVVSPWITHRHPAFWPDAEVFEPERFAPGAAAERHPYAYFPWAGGPRGCPAEKLGTLCVKLVLATLVQRYGVDLVPGHTIKRVREHVLRPSNGLPVRIASLARESATAPLR